MARVGTAGDGGTGTTPAGIDRGGSGDGTVWSDDVHRTDGRTAGRNDCDLDKVWLCLIAVSKCLGLTIVQQ